MSSELCTGYTFDERLGVYFTVQSSCLSVGAIVVLLSYALYRWVKRLGVKASDYDASGSSLFLNLMVSDLLQAIGALAGIRWMREGAITEGHLCTAQAVTKQIGINGVALSSLCIALHTFCVLVLRLRIPRHASKIAVLCIWAFTALVVGVPNAVHRKEVYYGNTGYWCWIMKEFKAAQIMSEYIWVWCSGIIMVLLYGIMFLVMRGFLIVGDANGVRWAKKQSRVRPDLTEGDEEEKAARDMANLLLFYPAVYVFCFIPNTISRWLYFSGHTIPFQATLFASSIFQFSGLFNVILYFSTRRDYAVGSAVHPAIITTLPQTEYSHVVKSAASPRGEGLDNLELEQLRYRDGREASYQSGNTDDHGFNGKVFQETVVHQSPPMRTVPLGGHSTATAEHLSPRMNRSHTANLHQVDDDDDDYGRLPM